MCIVSQMSVIDLWMHVKLGAEAQHKYTLNVLKFEYNLQPIIVIQVMSKIVLISDSL